MKIIVGQEILADSISKFACFSVDALVLMGVEQSGITLTSQNSTARVSTSMSCSCANIVEGVDLCIRLSILRSLVADKVDGVVNIHFTVEKGFIFSCGRFEISSPNIEWLNEFGGFNEALVSVCGSLSLSGVLDLGRMLATPTALLSSRGESGLVVCDGVFLLSTDFDSGVSFSLNKGMVSYLKAGLGSSTNIAMDESEDYLCFRDKWTSVTLKKVGSQPVVVLDEFGAGVVQVDNTALLSGCINLDALLSKKEDVVYLNFLRARSVLELSIGAISQVEGRVAVPVDVVGDIESFSSSVSLVRLLLGLRLFEANNNGSAIGIRKLSKMLAFSQSSKVFVLAELLELGR